MKAKSSFRPQARRVTTARAVAFEEQVPSSAIQFNIEQELTFLGRSNPQTRTDQ
jgi:hypothetical protein